MMTFVKQMLHVPIPSLQACSRHHLIKSLRNSHTNQVPPGLRFKGGSFQQSSPASLQNLNLAATRLSAHMGFWPLPMPRLLASVCIRCFIPYSQNKLLRGMHLIDSLLRGQATHRNAFSVSVLHRLCCQLRKLL